ncbi:hypothetical protein GOY07_01275 [Wolbachia endosymbiont of Litomosoides sigmodontis]|nr:hypothetical protein GOY07_01275 [Wolbachia endosymbiont of Litomosoides sigmodontis]
MKVVDSKGNLIEKVKRVINDPPEVSHSVTSTPRVAVTQLTSEALSIDCKKAGYKQLNAMISKSFNKVILLNLLWCPVSVIDTVTRAYKQYSPYYGATIEESSLQ